MTQFEVDRYIVRALGHEDVDDAALERMRAKAIALSLESGAATEASRKSARRLRVVRPWRLAFAVAALATVTGVAVAQPGPVSQLFGSDPEAPANKVDALNEPLPMETDGPRSAMADAFATEPSGMDEQSLETFMKGAPGLASTDPAGYGELLPIDEYLRLVLNYHRNGLTFQVFAAPTTKGNVCFWSRTLPLDSGTSQCTDKLSETSPLTAFTYRDSGSGRQFVHGLLVDGMSGVSVVLTDGTREAAVVGKNAYFWTSQDRTKRVASFVVSYSSGASAAVGLDGSPLN